MRNENDIIHPLFYFTVPYSPCLLIPKEWKLVDAINNLWFINYCKDTKEVHHESEWNTVKFGCNHCLHLRAGPKFKMCKECIVRCKECILPHLPKYVVNRPALKHSSFYKSCKCIKRKLNICLTCMYEYFDIKELRWCPMKQSHLGNQKRYDKVNV